MQSKITKWGNALGIRIPREIARNLKISSGDSMEMSVKDGSLIMTPVHAGEDLTALLEKVTPENSHGETDWGADIGRERH